jgi:hypothetical protein
VVTGLTVTNASIASLNAGTATVTSGNLTFSSTAQRITGDMSNATFSNRLAFQTSTANSATSISSLPNGTGTASNINCYNNSDPTNSSLLLAGTNATEALIQSAIRGTGTYLPMTFYTSGSERMRLDTSGNLGIGTSTANKSSSSTALTVNTGTAANYSAVEWSSNNTLNYHINANDSAIYHVAAGTRPWIVYTNGSERLRIDSSGNVGIGTASPVAGYRLNVVNDSGNGQQLIRAGTNYNSTISFGDQDSSTSGQVLYAHNGDYMRFDTNGSERLRIDSSGNVGIGTASPSYKLDVNTGVAGNIARFTDGVAQTFAVKTNASSIILQNDNSGNIVFNTGGERMRIDSSGNVGIGGTASAFEKVSVRGTLPSSSAFSFAYVNEGTIPSTTTQLAIGFYSAGTTQAASFTLSDYQHFRVWQGGFGAGSTVTNQYGFYVANNLTAATNNYGFYSNIASGSNRWNFYAAGTAQNYFAGNTGIGGTPAVRLDVQSTGNEVVKITATTGTNSVYQTMNNTAGSFTVGRENSAGTTFGVEAYSSALFSAGAYPMVFATNNVERMQISSVGNVKIGGTANRATTEGTRQLVLFDGTAPVGTLANGVSFYSASGEARVMDAAGNSTLLSPHDQQTNEWIFHSKHTPTGKVLKIDVEKMLRFINEHFGLDMVHEFTE